MSHRLLLVEDNYIHLSLTKEFFERQGYIVTGLGDGSCFLQTIETFKPDLILLDLKLPNIDGFMLLEQLSRSCWNLIPVIVVSAYAFPPERHRALSLGARQYLVKPTALAIIAEGVRRELQQKPQGDRVNGAPNGAVNP